MAAKNANIVPKPAERWYASQNSSHTTNPVSSRVSTMPSDLSPLATVVSAPVSLLCSSRGKLLNAYKTYRILHDASAFAFFP